MAKAKVDVSIKNRPTVDVSIFDQASGNQYGGQAEILALEVGEAAGPLTYTGAKTITTKLGEAISHTGNDAEGTSWRLPIAATFRIAVDQALLRPGDTFYVKRDDDVISFKFDKKGKSIEVYTLKVSDRAEHDEV